MRLGIPFLGMDEMRELGRVSDEEHRCIVENPIPVSLVSPELDCKASRVSSGVRRSRLASYSGESNGGFNLRTHRLE